MELNKIILIMRNAFLFLLLFFMFFVSMLSANDLKVEKIEITGNQRVDIETIISYSNLEIGDEYSNEIGNDVLKRLFDTNLFSNIEIFFDKNTLIISVAENPTINLVKFSGNMKIADTDLLVEIQLKERTVYSRSKVKNDIERMLSLYQRAGRLSTIIDPKVEKLDNNRVNLTYEIKESEISDVSKIIFIGNNNFSSSKLKSVMKTKEKTFLRFLSSSDKYDPDKIEYDKQLITEFYNNNGFPNFKFTSVVAELSPNTNNFEIILYVKEGEKYNFGEIKVNTELQKINSEAAVSLIPVASGMVFDRSKISDSIERIKELAEVSGYSFIKINPEFSDNIQDKRIDVTINVNEGPRVYVNDISISGNTRTVDKVIRRELLISEGDAYNKYNVNYSKDLIKSLNFFSEVSLEETKTEFPDKINLDISVEEKNTGEASIGAGYSSSNAASITLGLKETNFLGKGQRVNVGASFSDTRNTYDISLTEPYFNNKSLSLSTSIYSNFSDPASVNYDTEDLGFAISLGFPTAPDVSVKTRYSIFTTKVKADANATAYERLLAGTDTVSEIGYTLSLDRRNSRYKPSKGYNIIVDQDIAGLGGTSYFYKNNIEFNSYRRLSSKFIGSFKLQAGALNGYNDKYAPLSSNYKLGGKKLRGFKSGKVGPRTGNSYTGGQYYYVTSLETNFDFDFDAFDITSTLFADFGSVWGLENPAYSSIIDDHEMRSSIGINFNWDAAIGPINIVYANVLQSEATDTTDNIYFDIGYNF